VADEPGRGVYAEYIREQLEAQEARKASLEQRGLAIVGTSGGLVTLLFGLTALTLDRDGVALPTSARILLVVALVLFVAAGLAALMTNIPLSYEGVTAEALRGAVANRWDDTSAEAVRMTSLTRITVLESAKRKNNLKAVALFVGMVLEIVAVALVGAALVIALFA
jgi:hypothetical protein